ncbi:LpxI family protein [Hoeflea prorocentri]|uniref:LpxI family protein n=1 Tax=Hoeflea prorocentri TaxID=1922333 RepID=A0A9X3UHI3_9HYPH|nr:LpxI family protein [Hoeflea prorocentri]MCY6380935.1 LpxI family protein [Hoeflea prorocentri]MDA5398735.1 LpxI family protein [Hoeflea prorocentri]
METVGQKSAQKARLAIIAGRGRLPIDIARASQANGDDPFIIGLRGEASDIPAEFDHVEVGLGDAGRIQALLQERKIDKVVLSGGVNRRPEIVELRGWFNLLAFLPRVISALSSGGDDKLLRIVISIIESAGCRVVGAHEVVPDLLAQYGPITKRAPDKSDWTNIKAGCAGANALGALDVGQGAVAVGGRIVALEGAEGTDAMLARVAELRSSGRISAKRRGVLVKLCKPQQDERADLPSIGPDTVTNAHAAGLSGIAVDAGRALVLDRAAVVSEADRLGLFVTGVNRDQPAKND